MVSITEPQARAMAEYIFLSGFSKKAVLEIMSGPVKTYLTKEGYTIDGNAEKEWFDKDHEYSKWSTKFTRGMTFLGNPIDAGSITMFRKMQPLIVKSGSKSKNPAGLKMAAFKKDTKKEMLVNLETIAEGGEFEEQDIIIEGDDEPTPDATITPATSITIPGSIPRLTHTRQLRKRAFPEGGELPAGADTIVVTMGCKPVVVTDVAVSTVLARKAPNWTQPNLILMFTQGETVKYTFDNTSDIYELISGGEAVIFKGGTVTLTKFAQNPKSVQGFDAKLSHGTFSVSPSAGITDFFLPDNFAKDGAPVGDGTRAAPIMGFPIPDLSTTTVQNVDLVFNMREYLDNPTSRRNWFPLGRTVYTPLADGTITNPIKWCPLYTEVTKVAWSADSLEAVDAKYLQPLPFNVKSATDLDLSKQYIEVEMFVDAATDTYTGYDWKSPTSSEGTLIFPGDERNLIPLARDDPDTDGTEVGIKGAARGNAIQKILYHNNQARIEVDGGYFMIPDETGDGTFYAIDNMAGLLPNGEKQELKCRIKQVSIQDYGKGATPDDTWSNMKKARRYKNLATSILPAATDGPGRKCSVCGLDDVVAPCALEGCPMPTESEVGVASLGYFTEEASGTYLVLLVPDEDHPSNTYEIRMTVQN
jgi:hypothetical protein|tara:strand:+ start:203 stop:2134 length:1932 start_codon:yes stop_codon:yes gene_type:complete